MTMPKKGSRKIVVNGHVYRWVPSPDDGCLVVVVEGGEVSGQRLWAVMKYHDICVPDGPGVLRIVGQRRSITPSVVRKIILAAIGRGWQPDRPGLGEFRMDAEQILPIPE
jgi:hypothetical protein